MQTDNATEPWVDRRRAGGVAVLAADAAGHVLRGAIPRGGEAPSVDGGLAAFEAPDIPARAGNFDSAALALSRARLGDDSQIGAMGSQTTRIRAGPTLSCSRMITRAYVC